MNYFYSHEMEYLERKPRNTLGIPTSSFGYSVVPAILIGVAAAIIVLLLLASPVFSRAELLLHPPYLFRLLAYFWYSYDHLVVIE